MFKTKIILFCSLMLLLTACSKEDAPETLPESSVTFQLAAGKDTLEMPVSILKDSLILLELKATLTAATSSDDHWVEFAVDTTKITEYRNRFGNALVLPASAYLFQKQMTRIPAGSTISESAELNIGQQTKLTEYSTYVLPVVIKSVDGKPEGPASSRVIYYVFKTGKPLFLNKTGWTIEDFSSQTGTFAPTTLLDANNLTTYWASNIQQQMPQWVTINFNREVTFLSLNYYIPTALRYPTLGGYPTSIKIETSMDGIVWTDKGTYASDIANNMQSIPTGPTTARYLRFTALAAVKYASAYDAVFISGISLVP